MTTIESFGTLTIKNIAEESVSQNCILNVGVNLIGSSVNANVRLHDTTIEKLCIVEVKENGLVTIASLHVFPQTKVNETALLKNKKRVLNNGDVIKIANTEITYTNNNPRTCTQAEISKHVKQKIFPFTTPRRRSCNVGSSAKKAPTGLCWNVNNKESLFLPSPLVVKKNLPPKNNDDWPSEPLDQDQFPFVGHFSPKKNERPLQEVSDIMSASDEIFKPQSPVVNVVAPTVRISTCTSTSDFEKRKNDESMIPDATNISLVATSDIASNDVPVESFPKPNVRLSTRLSARKGSLPGQSTDPPTLRCQSRSSSCVTPTKVAHPLRTRLTMSEHKLSSESRPSFLESDSIGMENEHENAEMNSSTPTSASRTSNALTLMGTPTSIIKKRDSLLNKSLSFDKIEKADLANSEAREISKSRLFDQSLESVDGDSLALSTDTSSFVYKSAFATQPSAYDLEVEESMKGAELCIPSINKSLNSSTIVPNDSDLSGITSLASTPEPRNTTSNVKMMDSQSLLDVAESTSNQADLSFESAVSVHEDDDTTLKNSKIEEVPNYSSITISSNEIDLDTSDTDFDCTTEDERVFLKSEDEIEEIHNDVLILSESNSRKSQVQNIEEEEEFATELLTPEDLQSPAFEIFDETSTSSLSARKSRTVEETTQSSTNIGDGSSLILAIDQEEEVTNDSIVNDKTANKTFTLSQTPVKMTRNSEGLDQEENGTEIEQDAVLVQNYEETHQSVETSEDETTDVHEDSVVTEETVPERKSKRISLKQGTPVASGGSSTRKSRPDISSIRLNDKTIEIQDSEDTDTSTTSSDTRSKRNFKFCRTPVKNSPNTSAVRSTRKSKIPQTPLIDISDEFTEILDSEDTDATFDKSSRSSKLFRTPVKGSPAASEVRSTRKTRIILPPLIPLKQTMNNEIFEIPDFQDNSTASESKSRRSSKLLKTPVKNSPTVSRVGSTRKSILATPALQEITECSTPVQIDEESIESENMVTSVVGIQGSPITSEFQDITVDAEDTEDFDVSVVNQNKSSLTSKLLQTPLITFSPATPLVTSTRKSKIPHTALFQDEEIVEPTTDRKSKRISNLIQNSLILDSTVASVGRSPRKSKVPQTPLLSEDEDMDGSVLIETPLIQHSPIDTEVGSTRKSKIIHTPSLQESEIVESQDTSITTVRKSKRISKVLQASSISDSPVTSGESELEEEASEIGSIRKSIAFQESRLEEEETSQSDDSEDIDGSVFFVNNSRASSLLETPSMQRTPAEIRSARKSKVVQTPIQDDAEDNASTPGTKILQTPLTLNSPVASGIGSARKSKVIQKSLLEEEAASESYDSDDMDGSVFPENNSRVSSILETPSMQRTPAEGRSARKSKVVQTPIQDDVEDIASTPDTKVLQTPLILDSPVASGIGSARKSKLIQKSLLEEEAASESSDSEDMDGSVFPENNSRISSILETPSMQRTPAPAEGRSARKSKVGQTPIQDDVEDIASTPGTKVLQTPLILDSPVASGIGSARKSKLIQKSLLEEEAAFESSDSEDMDGSVFPENNSRISSILETPSMQRTPAPAEGRSARKSKVGQTPIQDDAEGTASTPGTKISQTPLILDSPVASGIGSARKSKLIQKSLLEEEAASEFSDSEDMDGSVFPENNSRISTILETPSMQRTPAPAEGRSARKSKAAQTPIQDDAIVEIEDTASTPGTKILQSPLISNSPVASGVGSARKSRVLQTSLLQDEEASSDGSEEMVGSVFTENVRRASTLLKTPSNQCSPAASKVRSTRKSEILRTSSLHTDATVESEDALVASNRKSKRISKVLQTPKMSDSSVDTVGSTKKSKVLQTPLLEDDKTIESENDSINKSRRTLTVFQTSSLQDDTECNTDEDVNESKDSEITEKEDDRNLKRASRVPNSPSLEDTPTASGIAPTEMETEDSNEGGSRKKPKRISNFLQTPTMQRSPIVAGGRSTRKSKISKTPLLLNTGVNVETEELDNLNESVNKLKIFSTPQNSPAVSGVRSTRKSKLSVTPTIQTRRGSKALKTPMIQEEEEASTSTASRSYVLQTPSLQDAEKSAIVKLKRTSKLLLTPSNQNTPVTSGIQVKRSSEVLNTPSMQDFNQTNSPLASGIKSKRISKLQQTSLLQEEINLSNASGRKSATPKNMEKSKTPVSSAIKRTRISKDFEETESPDTSPAKSGSTTKVLKFNTSTEQDESEVESSSAPKRRKIGKGTTETEPHNDLTDIKGVKTLFKTPKVQKQPRNDLTDVRGVKNILKTPKAVKEPENDLSDIKGVKKLMATPKVQNSPANDLTNVKGVKKLLKTPKEQKEPLNDLTEVRGVKRLLRTPKERKEPLNDLTDVDGVENLLREQEEFDQNLSDVVASPKRRKSANLSGLIEVSPSTSKKMTPERGGLSEVRFAKKILELKKLQKVQQKKSPKNDLTNVVGVKKMFAEEEAEYRKDFNISGVAEIMNESGDLFDSLLDKKPPKTYGRKISPRKSASVNNSAVSGTPVMSEEVVNWVNTQDFNKGEIVENLTPIKTKNNENVSISKKKDTKIHSSTPLDKGKRGILKEMETNIQNDVELSAKDKYLKKVQFFDDSDLRRSNRTPRTPSKINSDFVLSVSKRGRKRKVEENETAKVSKVEPEAKEDVIVIDSSETEPEDAVARKGVAKKTAKKASKAQSKKPTRSTRRGAQVEEEKDEESVQDVEVKTTRGRAVKKTKTVEKIEEIQENEGMKENSDEIEEIKAPKVTRGRSVKKSNAKASKKVEKIEEDNNGEVEEHEKIEAPKTTRGRALKTSQEVERIENDDEVEDIEEKTTRGRVGKAKKRKVVEKSESVNNDEVTENEEIPKATRGRPVKKTNIKANKKDEEVAEAPRVTRGRQVKKANIKAIEESLNEEKNESLKSTRSRRGAKKIESDEKHLDSSVIILSDSISMIEVPKKTRGRAVKTNKETSIEIPKTTRQRSAPKGEISINSTLESSTATTKETPVLPKTTRTRGVKRNLEEEEEKSITTTNKSKNNKKAKVENDSEVEKEAEIPKATRGRAVNKSGKKVVVEESEDEGEIAPKTIGNRVRSVRGSKKSIEDSETEEPKSKAGRGRKAKAGTKTEEEEPKSTKTRGTRKLYSLEDSVKIDIAEVAPVEVKKAGTRTRNVKQTAEVVAPVRSSRRTRK